jgi:hypothetical protein
MPPHCARFLSAIILVAAATACTADKKTADTDTSAALPGPVSVPSAGLVKTGWEDSVAGPAVFLPVPDNSAAALVVLPMMNDSTLSHDSTATADGLLGMSLELFDRMGSAGLVQLRSRAQVPIAEGCLSWPVLAFDQASPKNWRIGFKKGVVTSIPLDSLEGASPADSTFITTELARLASALSASNDPAFQGLPFSVRKAYRSKSGSTPILVGDIVRKINEEANPREEHLLLIAEPNPSDRPHYATVFHSRAAGSEEAVRTSDVLAAVEFVKNKRKALLVSFEYENGSRITLIERSMNGMWRAVWRSAYTGC